ncbi:hypothetical protein ACLOJK_024176 [Asimina triloba]
MAWEHETSIPGNQFGAKCIYCKQEMKSRVTRLKEHLAWMSSNVRNCPNVPKDVRTQMKEALQLNASNRRGHKKKEKEIAAKLWGFHYDVDDDDDNGGGGGDDEDDKT